MKRDRLAGLIDQGVFSVISLVQMLIYARLLPPEDFGLFAVTVSTVLVCHAMHWGLVLMPLTVATATSALLPLRSWSRWNLLVVGAMGMVCLLTGGSMTLLGQRGFASEVVWLSGCLVPGYLCFEYFRRRLFITGCSGRAPALILTWAGLQVVGVACVAWQFRSGAAAALAMAVASTAAAMVARRLPVPRDQDDNVALSELLAAWKRTIASNTAAVLPYLGYNTAMPLIVATLAGPAAAGMFSATRLFLSPVSTLANAIGTVDKPRAAQALRERGAVGLRRALLASARTLCIGAVPYALVIMLFGEWIVAWTLGPRFADHVDVVRLWMLVGLLVALGHPVETGLIVLDRARHVFWSRLLATALALLVLVLLAQRGAIGAVAAVATAWLASLVVGLVLLGRELRAADSGRSTAIE